MKTDELKKEQRQMAREERLPLLHRETFLSESYCSVCPMNHSISEANSPDSRCGGCPVYGELRGIGDGLLEVSHKYYTMPEELTWTAYQEIKDKLEWSKKQIAKHYGVGLAVFTEFTHRYEKLIPDTYEEEINMDLKVEKVEAGKPEDVLTLERYLEMQADGKSDQAIIRELGLTQNIMNKFKNANNLVRKKGPKRGKGKGTPKQQKAAKPVKETPVVELPKDEPIEVVKHNDVDKLAEIHAKNLEDSSVRLSRGNIDLSNSDIIGHTGVWGGSVDLPSEGLHFPKAEPQIQKIFIVMDTTDEAGSRSIKAIRSTKELAYLFIAEYVLAEDVNTAYLELVEKIVDAEEVY